MEISKILEKLKGEVSQNFKYVLKITTDTLYKNHN